MPVKVLDDAGALADAAAEHVALAARIAIRERDAFHLALAGGNTPRAMHEKLANRDDMSWAKVHAWFGEFRVDAAGRALLVGLRGADLQAL